MRLAPLLLCLVVTGLVACGGDEEPAPEAAQQESTATATATAEAQAEASGDGTVTIKDFKYVPEELAVEAGTTVQWTNEDAAPHTATADDGSFDTGDLRQGDTGEVTVGEPGEYEYYCEFHQFMRGRITVQ